MRVASRELGAGVATEGDEGHLGGDPVLVLVGVVVEHKRHRAAAAHPTRRVDLRAWRPIQCECAQANETNSELRCLVARVS